VSSKCFQLYYTCSDRLLTIALPLALSIFFPLLLWRFQSSQLFCVHYKSWFRTLCRRSKFIENLYRVFHLKRIPATHGPTSLWQYWTLTAVHRCCSRRTALSRHGRIFSTCHWQTSRVPEFCYQFVYCCLTRPAYALLNASRTAPNDYNAK